MRTCQEFATDETTFPRGYGGISDIMDPPDLIGRRLKAIREALDIDTQEEFAEALGYGKSTYNPWETGKRALTFEAALKIRAKFRIPLDFMFFGEAADQLPAKLLLRMKDVA